MQQQQNPKKSILCTLLALLLVSGVQAQEKLHINGYFSTRYEKQFATYNTNGKIAEADPSEWTSPFFNIMFQQQLESHFRIFINLNGAKASTIDVRNYWGEYSLNNLLNVRFGKIYRKFGLYNEILDAVPTYYGIEPPELFDTDHLMISRTTTLMVFGKADISAGSNINYSVSTDNGEGGSVEGVIPIGFDINYQFNNGDFTIGTSGYSSGGDALPDLKVGSGSPKSGVLPWMTKDKFNVLGAYAEFKINDLLLQSEYWNSSHDAVRNPAGVITLVQKAGLNSSQLKRFLINPSKSAASLSSSDVVTNTSFNIQTWYLRAGYSFETSFGEIAPYIQWDWYSNPETIENKTYGGDAEAGAADDGVFNKSTVGIIYRPIPEVAVKFDQSYHFFKQGGESVYYPEIRLDISYIFGN